MDEDYLDRVRAYHQAEAYAKAMRKRKLWTEPLFAEAKLWGYLARKDELAEGPARFSRHRIVRRS